MNGSGEKGKRRRSETESNSGESQHEYDADGEDEDEEDEDEEVEMEYDFVVRHKRKSVKLGDEGEYAPGTDDDSSVAGPEQHDGSDTDDRCADDGNVTAAVEEDPPIKVNAFKDRFKLNGTNQRGFVKNLQNVVQRGKRSYRDERQQQILRHISVQLLYAAQKRLWGTQEFKSVVEVQAMFVGNSIFIATNKDCEAEAVFEALKTQDTTRIALTTPCADGYLTGGKNDKKIQKILSKRHAAKLNAFYDRTRALENGAGDIFKLISGDGVKRAMLDVDDVCSKHFTEPGVYVLKGNPRKDWGLGDKDSKKHKHKDGRHAEMKLVYALVKSGHIDEKGAVIAGKKRPCFGCLVALRHFAKYYRIRHGQNPGKIWFHTFRDEIQDVQKEWEGVLDHTPINITRVQCGESELEYQGAGTESDSPAPGRDTDLSVSVASDVESVAEKVSGRNGTRKSISCF